MRSNGRLFCSRVVSRDATAIFTAQEHLGNYAVLWRLFQGRVAVFKIACVQFFNPSVVHMKFSLSEN
jgi:hypothetical protein